MPKNYSDLVMTERIFVLDQPIANLDSELTSCIAKVLDDFMKKFKTVLQNNGS